MRAIHILLALLAGLGLGLAYSWGISPVTYVDASPAILRADFKDQYRIVIAASYLSTHDLARARARLEILGDTDPIGELGAQAQRMVGTGESSNRIDPLAQLTTDLQQGFASIPSTSTPFENVPASTVIVARITDTPPAGPLSTVTQTKTAKPPSIETQSTIATVFPTLPLTATNSFAQTAFAPVATSTFAPRPTFTPIPPPGAPFKLVDQELVCEPGAQPGLLQFILMDRRGKQVPGIEIIVTSDQGEDRFFTGFKPELGNGYADFVMQAEIIYSVRVVEGGASVPELSAPNCKDPNGVDYIGGWLLTFQQP